MKKLLAITFLSIFLVGCGTIKEQCLGYDDTLTNEELSMKYEDLPQEYKDSPEFDRNPEGVKRRYLSDLYFQRAEDGQVIKQAGKSAACVAAAAAIIDAVTD